MENDADFLDLDAYHVMNNAEEIRKCPLLIREGGSIGAVVTMQKAWKVPILFMGLSLPEHGYHAPNEYFDWGQASGGMKAFVHYLQELTLIR